MRLHSTLSFHIDFVKLDQTKERRMETKNPMFKPSII